MTPGDDLDRIKQTLDYVAVLQRSHDEQIIARLARIADIHENRIEDLESPPQ